MFVNSLKGKFSMCPTELIHPKRASLKDNILLCQLTIVQKDFSQKPALTWSLTKKLTFQNFKESDSGHPTILGVSCSPGPSHSIGGQLFKLLFGHIFFSRIDAENINCVTRCIVSDTYCHIFFGVRRPLIHASCSTCWGKRLLLPSTSLYPNFIHVQNSPTIMDDYENKSKMAYSRQSVINSEDNTKWGWMNKIKYADFMRLLGYRHMDSLTLVKLLSWLKTSSFWNDTIIKQIKIGVYTLDPWKFQQKQDR